MAGAKGTIAGLFAAIALLPGLNLFGTTSAAASGREHATAHDDATPATTRLRATVLSADGTTIKGAVVVTNAGGQGVNDDRGVSLFDVAVDEGLHELTVTAVGCQRAGKAGQS